MRARGRFICLLLLLFLLAAKDTKGDNERSESNEIKIIAVTKGTNLGDGDKLLVISEIATVFEDLGWIVVNEEVCYVLSVTLIRCPVHSECFRVKLLIQGPEGIIVEAISKKSDGLVAAQEDAMSRLKEKAEKEGFDLDLER